MLHLLSTSQMLSGVDLVVVEEVVDLVVVEEDSVVAEEEGCAY
jgi:hypothetical protein